jgi:matrixin
MNASRQFAGGTLAAMILLLSALAHAGGSLDTVDITSGNVTVPGTIDGDLIPIKWDARCIPVNFTLDVTPPNALSFPAQTVALAVTRVELQTAMNQWNRLLTSFIQLNITAVRDLNGGVLTPPQAIGAFDFINEINFVTQGGFLASAPSVSLIKDTTLGAGQDIDLDGDSDVFTPSAARGRTCRDVDADGDIEFPAGLYKAGTILETDVGFSAINEIPWNITPDAARTADIRAVAVHEFGHSHGLSHSLINQTSRGDGSGASMFPFLDINDPAGEQRARSLAMDDIAWSSFLYPEGSASSGPGALQPDDRRFTDEFGLVRGKVTSGTRPGPVVGANVWLEDLDTGAVVVCGFSGKARVLVVPGASGTDFDATVQIGPSRDFTLVDGNYVIPAPPGRYKVGLQALDGLPVAPGSISTTAMVGAPMTDPTFPEEFWNGSSEFVREIRPGDATPVLVAPGQTRHVDFKTNAIKKLTVGRFTPDIFDGFLTDAPGTFLAVRYGNAEVRAFLAGSVLHSAAFLTTNVDDSIPVRFKSVMLATGRVTGERTVSIDLNSPLQKVSPFIAQDTDFSPWYFQLPVGLTRSVEQLLELNPQTDLFVVLELPDEPLPGVSAQTPFIGFDFESSLPPTSYRSTDGGVTFISDDFGQEWFFDLLATQ